MQLASIASNRLEALIRRISGFVHLLVAVEVVVNGFGQVQAVNGLNTVLFVAYVGIAFITLLSLWFGSGRAIPLIYGLAILLMTICMPLTEIAKFNFTADGRPWIWWAIGFAAILVAVFTKTWQWTVYVVAISVIWFTGQVYLFGEERVLQASLDSAFFIVYCFAVMALVSLVREGAAEVDMANGEAIQSSLQQAKTEAIERERQRVDALVHDQVLHTLLLAARAQRPDEIRAAGVSAATAIRSLEQAQSDQDKSELVTTAGLFRALENAAAKLDPRVKVEISGSNLDTLAPEVAQAITEATLQALDNSIQHSKAQAISLLLASDGKGVKFVVRDDGVGFRADRVSKDRIGISTSILFRMDSVRGVAEIESAPGKGTTVTLRWPND
ncbi:MAG: hypothetical protein RL600_1019 [Actinomycetota bacterium]